MNAAPSVSVCLVVRNAEDCLDRCLASVHDIAHEIILVHDGECEDRSLEIARNHGARIFVRPFAGTSEAHRTFGFERASGEWILRIDADEFLHEETIRRIPELVCRPDIDAYALRWPAFNGTRYVSRGPFSRLYIHCLFRKSRMCFLGITHLAPSTYGTTQIRLDLLMEHRPAYDNWTLSTFRRKFLPWCRIEAMQLIDYEHAPRFQMDAGHAELRRCRRRRDHPIWSGADEVGGYTWRLVKDGLLWAGAENLKMYFFVTLRIASVYWYIIKFRARRTN